MPDIPQNTGTTRASNKRADAKSTIGISFPFRKEDGEFPKRVADGDCVQNDLLTLFKTPLRSRIHRPLFGHTGHRAVFESQGSLLNARLQRSTRQTIKNNEPRVKVLSLTIENKNTETVQTIDYVSQGVRDKLTLDPIQTK